MGRGSRGRRSMVGRLQADCSRSQKRYQCLLVRQADITKTLVWNSALHPKELSPAPNEPQVTALTCVELVLWTLSCRSACPRQIASEDYRSPSQGKERNKSGDVNIVYSGEPSLELGPTGNPPKPEGCGYEQRVIGAF